MLLTPQGHSTEMALFAIMEGPYSDIMLIREPNLDSSFITSPINGALFTSRVLWRVQPIQPGNRVLLHRQQSTDANITATTCSGDSLSTTLMYRASGRYSSNLVLTLLQLAPDASVCSTWPLQQDAVPAGLQPTKVFPHCNTTPL